MKLKNKYINLNRLEFIVTDRCTSCCEHCIFSHERTNGIIDVNDAIDVLVLTTSMHNIDSVMTFGGEPLLYPEITCRIHKEAYELGVPSRQVITNGYWSNNIKKSEEIALMLKESHVNHICISVDVFHQKFLPLEHVKETIKRLSEQNFDYIALNPCWFDSPEGENEYDEETRQIIDSLSSMGVEVTEGNIMVPNPNSLSNFPNHFERKLDFSGITCTDIPYSNCPDKITSICINTDGTVNICNGKKYKFSDFISEYDPYDEIGLPQIISGGVDLLIDEAKKQNVFCDPKGYFSICGLCIDLRRQMNL